MLRAINPTTTHRPPQAQAHRARPAKAPQETGTESNKEENAMKNENMEREAYIGFIVKMLNERADLRAVKIVYEFVLRLID